MLNTQVFTNIGVTMLGQADTGQVLTINRIVVGSGSASQDSDLYPLTALINWKADVTINRKQDLGNGVMLVNGVLNEGLCQQDRHSNCGSWASWLRRQSPRLQGPKRRQKTVAYCRQTLRHSQLTRCIASATSTTTRPRQSLQVAPTAGPSKFRWR